MNETTIKISKEAHQRLREKKKSTGASIRFMIDKALDALWGENKPLKKGIKNDTKIRK